MTISKKPAKGQNPDEFIQEAPDGSREGTVEGKGIRRGRRRQITVTITDQLLADLDKTAAHYGMSRSAAINQAVRRWVDSEDPGP